MNLQREQTAGLKFICRWTVLFVFTSGVISSCVYDFTPSDFEQSEDLVVIEGDIIAGDYSYFKISSTLDLASSENVVYRTDAVVWVEGETGEKVEAYLSEDVPGAFAANTSKLDVHKKYKLCVDVPGKGLYESSYVSVFITAPIDSITYFVGADKDFVQIEVTSHDNDRPENRYYKWNYREDWEFRAYHIPELIYNADLDKEEAIPASEQGKNFYCWSKEFSSGIYIASTEKLSENVAYKQQLSKIYSDNRKISYIYSIQVSQVSLTKEGYIYWETLQKNTDETGGMFAPQPSELRGNIKSVTNPEEIVLGYVSASTISKERIYIYATDIKNIYKDAYAESCYLRTDSEQNTYYPHWGGDPAMNLWLDLYRNGYAMIHYFVNDNGKVVTSLVGWLPGFCSDCRKLDGTKEKPSFWPNNHE